MGDRRRHGARFPQHSLAMAHHLGQAGDRLPRIQGLAVPAAPRRTGPGRRNNGHPGRQDRPSRRVAGQARERTASQDLLRLGEGQLLVQQLRQHRLFRRPCPAVRGRKPPGPGDFQAGRPSTRLDGRRSVSHRQVPEQAAGTAAAGDRLGPVGGGGTGAFCLGHRHNLDQRYGRVAGAL